ncbi:MAG: hypothetical protein V1867_01650 [Candidatus Falkowbacteria bacterium]
MKKTTKIFLVILASAAAAAGAYLSYIQYRINRGDILEYDGKWYTKEQVRELFGPQYYEVESKNTPEEVYAAFREALLRDDKETALMLIREERKEKYINSFSSKNLIDLGSMYPEIITKDELNSTGNHAVYKYNWNDGEKDTESEIFFTKNSQGYWEIDGI